MLDHTTSPEAPPAASGVVLTERAAQEVRSILAHQRAPHGTGVRIAVKGGGCSGFTYVMNFEASVRPDDIVTEQHGVRVIVDPRSLLFLEGTTLEFQDTLMGRGFVFKNPKATRTCGCGSSFAV